MDPVMAILKRRFETTHNGGEFNDILAGGIDMYHLYLTNFETHDYLQTCVYA